MEEYHEIILLIQDQVFKVRKDVLCEHSDYFSAMFSGNYVEKEQEEINIDVVDANSMNIILRYMEMGLIDLGEYDLSAIGDLAVAANFLQITELIKQIKYCLDIQLSPSNWIETMEIAENACFNNLEQLSAAYGLLSFKSMKPEYVPSIQHLCWYLSHPYLDARSELKVFKFGLNWIKLNEIRDDEDGGDGALLIILGCLDLKKLNTMMLTEMSELVKNSVKSMNNLATKVIDCLLELSIKSPLTLSSVTENKFMLTEMFTERVFNEVLCLIKESKSRKQIYTPTVPIWLLDEEDRTLELVPHCMYTFSEDKGFKKWLEVADENIWGWNIVSWDAFKVVVLCGEYGRGTGTFMKDVRVYDVLREEWVTHGVQLPPRRHGGVTVVGDSLFIIGGVGGFRVILDSAIVYDLKQCTYRKIANLPDVIQNPTACNHNDEVYVAGHKNIYKYEDLGQTDRWVTILSTNIRISSMVSFNDYIYCTQNYFSHLYRFRPGIDNDLEMIANFTNPPNAVCNLGDRLLYFTRTVCGHTDLIPDILSAEEYRGIGDNEQPKVVWSETGSLIKVNDVAGACSLVMAVPVISRNLSHYHKSCLKRFNKGV